MSRVMKFMAAALATTMVAVLASPQDAVARSPRVNQIPNDFGCGTCHDAFPPINNPFGIDAWETFSPNLQTDAGGVVDWGVLSQQDSDGDGLTNGEELGDPMGTWSAGDPDPAGPTTNPAIYTANCGNDLRDASNNEDCDGTDLNGETCQSQGFSGGTLSCSASCTFDTSACMDACGNGQIDAGEDCDGNNLNNGTCQTEGFDGGALSCDANCQYVTAACTTCGDGQIDAGEECDGTALGGETCQSQSFDGGMLACSANCTFDTAMCTSCGDGMVGGSEECDGNDLDGETCASRGFLGGNLSCTPNTCLFDTSGCMNNPNVTCGDDMREGMEVCDGADLDGQTCQSQGFMSGVLGCGQNCDGFDTSGCASCGDGVIGGDEECDGAALGGATCLSEGFDGGMITCKSDCTLDTSSCRACGNMVREVDEECDFTDFGGETCESQGFGSGMLLCSGMCTIDTRNCDSCGNGVLDAGEACDGMDFGASTCQTEGFDEGMLGCNTDCTIDASTCMMPCSADASEQKRSKASASDRPPANSWSLKPRKASGGLAAAIPSSPEARRCPTGFMAARRAGSSGGWRRRCTCSKPSRVASSGPTAAAITAS